MIIDFTVENYRSIKEPVTLSAIAQRRGASRSTRRAYVKPDHEIAPPYPVEGHGFELLPVLAIFGANASGKSNVILAMDNLLRFMDTGWPQPWERFVPFRLDQSSLHAPTHFELRVALHHAIYTYTLTVDRERILQERLEYIPALQRRRRLLFDRKWEESDGRYCWNNGSDFAGPHVQLETTLQKQEPFICMFIDRIEVDVLRDLAHWLRNRWQGVGLGSEVWDQQAMTLPGYNDSTLWAKAVETVRRFDTGLTNIEAKIESAMEHQVFAVHEGNVGSIRWPFQEESDGTRRLFSLAYKMYFAFQNAIPLIVDELGSNLHPNIVHEIVRLFQNPQTNPKRAQLIFTSHDNTLQRGQLLRRDQIWFTQKRVDGSTDLYPLSDFKVRNDLAIDRAYLEGRFGAVPLLPTEEEFAPFQETDR